MSISRSLKLFDFIGQDVMLTCEYEGYPSGSIAVVEEFAFNVDGSFFRIRFQAVPGSLEDIDPDLLSQIGWMPGSRARS